MTRRRYIAIELLLTFGAVMFAILGVTDSSWWFLLAFATILGPIRGFIHYGSGTR